MNQTQEFLLLYILLIHFLGDFALQTHEQATKKSTNIDALTKHVSVYSFIWFLATFTIFGFENVFYFTIITFITHWITDFITSRIGKSYWDKGDYHNGFVIVGVDQICHYIQLWLTFKLFLYD